MKASLAEIEGILQLAKEYGVARLDVFESGEVFVEFHQPAPVFEVVTPKTDEEQTEPGGYETALERMARGGKKEAPKT